MHRSTFLSWPAGRLALAAPLAAGLAVAVAVIPAGMASAAPAVLPANCTQSGTTVTCTFGFTGTPATWTVPAGVTSAALALYGGSGGSGGFFIGGQGGAGGAGAEVTGTVSLSGIASLTLNVAGAGGAAGFPAVGGYGGGGDAGAGTGGALGGSGGGATTVSDSAGTLLLVAGGGGGGGVAADTLSEIVANGGNGGNADTAGQPGQALSDLGVTATGGGGGGAGTQTAGGAGGPGASGTSSGSCFVADGSNGNPGSSGQGGSAAGNSAGAGGGGGFFGGGQGGEGVVDCDGFGAFGGGGGGSSFTGGPGVSGAAVNDSPGAPASLGGNGEVIISYQALLTATTTSLASSPDPSVYGSPVTFTATVTPSDGGGTVAFVADGSAISGCGSQPLTQGGGGAGTATCTTSALPAGSHAVLAFYSGDTALAASSGSLAQTVTPAPLTITASSETMTYGGTPPVITPAYSGFVNGDTAGSLTTQPACSTTATSTSAVGAYPSSCSGAADPNYAISYIPGSVTVTPVALTIAASSGTMTQGATPPAITPAYSGFVNGDGPGSLTTQPACSTTATSSSSPGAYPSSCSGAADPNYAISYIPGSVTVTSANTVTVTNPDNQTGTVGTAVSLQIQATDSASGQTLTYSATGLPAGLSINSATGLISGAPTTAGTSSVTVTAKDTTGASGSASFTWTVNSGTAACPSGTKANFRWHYTANGNAGGWSGTATQACPGSVSMGPQAMDGNLQVAPGATLQAGYDFTLPGNKNSLTMTVSAAKVTFAVSCVSGATPSASTLTVPLSVQTYQITNDQWYPSGDQSSPLVYQGSVTVPNLCGGGKISLAKGGTFTATLS